ncbi:MAG: AAC(3) family N-acetyltransferase [Methyloprofundus sp.]|nr:AAC(3) family N-acetyltransferase [Methyloprofundus sp.]
MVNRHGKSSLVTAFKELGIKKGDVLLIRAGLGSVGPIEGGATTFVEALIETVGAEGTVFSLAFTSGSVFLKKPKIDQAFHINKKSYAGALPNAMLKNTASFRSHHPMCSYVAIGKHAEYLTQNHDHESPAYEPVRKVIELGGKCVLVGCVKDSPGFTTTHLAEADLGLLSLNIFPKLRTVYYKTGDGNLALFKRTDPGLCSKSFYKFYAHYVLEGILYTGRVGGAYSIVASAADAYMIDKKLLSENKKFNICGSPDCFVCNAGRWDRIQYFPGYILRRIFKKLIKMLAK